MKKIKSDAPRPFDNPDWAEGFLAGLGYVHFLLSQLREKEGLSTIRIVDLMGSLANGRAVIEDAQKEEAQHE